MKKYSVETSQEKVLSTKKVSKKNSIKYKNQTDTYEIVGRVSFISEDKEAIWISVGDIDFWIDHKEINISDIKIQDKVKIEIEELILWDEGIY